MLLILLACGPGFEETTTRFPTPLDGGGLDTPIEELPEPEDTGPWRSGVVEPDPPPGLMFNEVMSNNRSAWSPAPGEMPDWIELFNPTVSSVPLARVAVKDRSGSVWYGSAGELLPGGYYILYADGQDTGDHTPFGLGAAGDELVLYVDGLAVDRIALGELPDDVSWARFPDGGSWDVTIDVTPGDTNGMVASETLDPADNLWGTKLVHRVDITLDAATMARMGRNWVDGGFALDGVNFDPVNMRLRGSMTYVPISGKASFKVDLNDFFDTDYRGVEAFNILNMYWEASLAREYIGYHIFREMGVPACRNAYTELWVNDEYYGLYLLSELYDDVFLDSFYGDQDGFMLWEPESGDFTTSAGSWDCEEEPCDASKVTPIAEILERHTSTDADIAEMEVYLDLENALWEIAIEGAIDQWDGYCAVHNYRVAYNPATELVQLIPSSLDLTFGAYSGYTMDLYTCSGKLLSFCLNNTACAERYETILLDLADYLENGEIDVLQDTLFALSEPYMAADEPRDQYTYTTYVSHHDTLRGILADLPANIRAAVAAR